MIALPTLLAIPLFALAHLAMAEPTAAPAIAAPEIRWVTANDVRVRSRPDLTSDVMGKLQRGDELSLAAIESSFCLIRGAGHWGYVACQFLGTEPVARSRAGENGLDPAQRWVTGSAVALRSAPRENAAAIKPLGLNAMVRLDTESFASGYCKVRPLDGPGGYISCRYLASTPVVMAQVRGERSGDGSLSTEYDPARAFWIEPGWQALVAYAEYLKTRNPDAVQEGRWPVDPDLDQMKSHLALGHVGPVPKPYADWAELKRKAAQEMDLSPVLAGDAHSAHATQEMQRRIARMSSLGHELQKVIGLYSPLHYDVSNDGAARVIYTIRGLELPAVAPSFFRADADLELPGSTERVSGRFGIVFRDLVTPRPQPGTGLKDQAGAGLYDMLTHTQLLTHPVQHMRLFRDGRLQTAPDLVRIKQTLWYDDDGPSCEDWSPGFGAGDATADMWKNYDGGFARAAPLDSPRDSLFNWYMIRTLPGLTARHTETKMRLNREQTGFIGGTYLSYDLDNDGVVDLTVWEGQGKGPGHLDGPTTTDDRWYRLVFVNINGAWKILGSDIFSYGCGC